MFPDERRLRIRIEKNELEAIRAVSGLTMDVLKAKWTRLSSTCQTARERQHTKTEQ